MIHFVRCLCIGVLIVDIVWLIAVAALWGCTNPFLKKGSKGIEHVQCDRRLLRLFRELQFLVSNWKVCCIRMMYFSVFIYYTFSKLASNCRIICDMICVYI